jgi:hypothetical protein
MFTAKVLNIEIGNNSWNELDIINENSLSPILLNIYLHEFDVFMTKIKTRVWEQENIQKYQDIPTKE